MESPRERETAGESKVLSGNDNTKECVVMSELNEESHHQVVNEPDLVMQQSAMRTSNPSSASSRLVKQWLRHMPTNRILSIISVFSVYNVYLVLALWHHFSNQLVMDWCEGLGFILLLTTLIYLALLHQWLLRPRLRSIKFGSTKLNWRRIRLLTQVAAVVATLLFILIDAWHEKERVISIGGTLLLVAIGAAISRTPRKIDWQTVVWGLLLQFVLALVVLRWPTGRRGVECLGNKIDNILSFSDQGSGFVFGHLVHQQPFLPERLNASSVAHSVALELNEHRAVASVVVFKSLSVIYFFSFLCSILFYLGVIQYVTIRIGNVLRVLIGTSACESLVAASNIFLGQAMVPILIQPYLSRMTRSEIHCVMTSGFATIAGTVMAAYISFGIAPAHLLSASVMSAPAALAAAKLVYPETQHSQLTDEDIKLGSVAEEETAGNLLDAATRGASKAALLVLNITAIVVAFVASVAMLNALVEHLALLVGFEDVDFQTLLGKLFVPLAFSMGVEWSECSEVGTLIGLKMVANEFIAYRRLGLIAGQLSPRSVIIATYALCGFANPGSMGVQMAIFSSLCPQRKLDFAQIVPRAFIAGSIACFFTACIAGALAVV